MPAANREGVGPPRKYMPRKRIPADLRSLARGHTALCVKVLAGIVQNGRTESARAAAAAILLDRGWGRAVQMHAGNEDGGPIQVVIRHIAEGGDRASDAKVIDVSPMPQIANGKVRGGEP